MEKMERKIEKEDIFLSRKFIEASQKKLEEMMRKDPDGKAFLDELLELIKEGMELTDKESSSGGGEL